MDITTDMQHQAMGYDRAATMFSPEGHLLQVEYAEKTVRLGSSSIGMVCSDGVFILADRRIKDRLIALKSANKIYEVDEHIIASVAGIVSDARILVEKAQVLAQQHRVTYDSEIEPELIIKEIANTKQMFTQYGGVRPYGVSIMIAGISKGKSEIYTSDITGNYFSYHANAIGENDDKIKEKLREKWKKDLTVKQGINLALEIYKEIKGKETGVDNFELAYIENKNPRLKRLEGEEIDKL
ncbi:MAG: archaeal proteasome endopeptidase complex subunit alpha [Nanoarchaeota archaeon]